MSGENSNKPENRENLDLVREVVAMNRNLLDYLLNGRSSSVSTNLMNLFNTQMSKEINDLRDVIIELREQISRNQEQHAKDIRDILNRTHQNRTSINQTTSTSSSSQTEVKSQTVATQTKVKLQKTIDTQTEIEPESPNIPTTSISTDTESTPNQEASSSTSTSKRPVSPSSSLPDLDLSVSDAPYIKVESLEHQGEVEIELTNLSSQSEEETGNFKRRRVSYNLRNQSKCDEMDIKFQPSQDNRMLVDEGQIRLPYTSENATIEKGLRDERLKMIYSVIQRYRKVEHPLGLSAYTVRNFKEIPKRAKYSVYFFCYARSASQCPVKLVFEYVWETQKYELYRLGSHTHILNYQNNSKALQRWEKRLEKDEKASILD